VPRLEYFFVAEDVAIDQSTNRVSAFNILEELTFSDFPAIFPRMAAISLWCREAEEDPDQQAMLSVVLPDGEAHQLPANFVSQSRRQRVVQRVEGVLIRQPGTIKFEISLNGEYQASHTVDVVGVEQDQRSLAG